MNPHELRILDEIESAMLQSDAALAARLASGPRLSNAQKASVAAATLAGIALVMLFPTNVLFGVTGYLVLVAVGTAVLRSRPLQPVQQSPMELVHRFTAGLFRDSGDFTEPDDDER